MMAAHQRAKIQKSSGWKFLMNKTGQGGGSSLPGLYIFFHILMINNIQKEQKPIFGIDIPQAVGVNGVAAIVLSAHVDDPVVIIPKSLRAVQGDKDFGGMHVTQISGDGKSVIARNGAGNQKGIRFQLFQGVDADAGACPYMYQFSDGKQFFLKMCGRAAGGIGDEHIYFFIIMDQRYKLFYGFRAGKQGNIVHHIIHFRFYFINEIFPVDIVIISLIVLVRVLDILAKITELVETDLPQKAVDGTSGHKTFFRNVINGKVM